MAIGVTISVRAVSLPAGRRADVRLGTVRSGQADAPAQDVRAGASCSPCSGSPVDPESVRVQRDGLVAAAAGGLASDHGDAGAAEGPGLPGEGVDAVFGESADGFGFGGGVVAVRHASTINHPGHRVNTISGILS